MKYSAVIRSYCLFKFSKVYNKDLPRLHHKSIPACNSYIFLLVWRAPHPDFLYDDQKEHYKHLLLLVFGEFYSESVVSQS